MSAERKPFTQDEQVAILRAARGDRLYPMVVLAHGTGLRQSELLGLIWPELDLDAQVIFAASSSAATDAASTSRPRPPDANCRSPPS